PCPLDADRPHRGRSWMSPGTGSAPAPVASGHCAGPRLADFAGSLPAARFNPRRLRRRGTRLSLAGRFAFRAGPLLGHVISTVVLRSDGLRTVRDEFSLPPERARFRRMLTVSVNYAVRRAVGEFNSDFRSVNAPIC